MNTEEDRMEIRKNLGSVVISLSLTFLETFSYRHNKHNIVYVDLRQRFCFLNPKVRRGFGVWGDIND